MVLYRSRYYPLRFFSVFFVFIDLPPLQTYQQQYMVKRSLYCAFHISPPPLLLLLQNILSLSIENCHESNISHFNPLFCPLYKMFFTTVYTRSGIQKSTLFCCPFSGKKAGRFFAFCIHGVWISPLELYI